MPPIPITILTGFLGSGKTTVILNLLPQLPKDYKIALLKNEFGDLAIDSQLASAAAISGVQELLNGCICCNLVGQLGDALDTLRKDVSPDRIIVETSGSAFPATLALEVNRLGRESGHYVLDGVIVVIDVENWQGYEDTSYTAKLQAKYTDLVIFNKWELVGERRYDDCLDRLGDLEMDLTPIKSAKGLVSFDVLLGLDSALARKAVSAGHHHSHEDHKSDHQSEVEVLSIALTASDEKEHGIDLDALETLLLSAPKDEVYRIKAIVSATRLPRSSDGQSADVHQPPGAICQYILNWAFGRWTYTPVATPKQTISVPLPQHAGVNNAEPVLKMTIITARGYANKWKGRIASDGTIKMADPAVNADLEVQCKLA